METLLKAYDAVAHATIPQIFALAALIVPGLMSPWDKVFRRIFEQKVDLVAIATLRDGRRVASRLLDPAYASTYPAGEQILLGEMWKLDEDGRLVAPYAGSYGMLIDKADIETLELIEWSSVAAQWGRGSDQMTQHQNERPVNAIKGHALPTVAQVQPLSLREGIPMPARPAGSTSPVAPLPPGSAVPPKK